MLNQTHDRRIGLAIGGGDAGEARMIGRESEWCVGEPAGRWDVSFGAKLAAKLKSWLGLGLGVAEAGRDEVQAPTMKVVSLREPVGMRKAA